MSMCVTDRGFAGWTTRLTVGCLIASILSVWCLGQSKAWAGESDSATGEDGAREHIAQGRDAFDRGDLQSAIAHWASADQRFEATGDDAGRVDALRNQATALRVLGQLRLAGHKLETARQLAEQGQDPAQLIDVYNDWAVLQTLTRQWGPAQQALDQALAMAEEAADRHAQAGVLNNVGNLLSAQGLHGQALERYEQCAALAGDEQDSWLQAQALANGGLAAIHAQAYPRALWFTQQAMTVLQGLASTYRKASLLITLGRINQGVITQDPTYASQQLGQTQAIYQEASRVARQMDDQRTLSYIYGYLAQLYELENRLEEAQTLTHRAVFAAQQVQAADALYRWQWQAGRLWRAQGQTTEALKAYRRAVQTFDTIREDVAVGYGNRAGGGVAGSSFRQNIGPMFTQLADLLLSDADAQDNEDRVQAYLREARETIERFKTAELVDYFQDECVGLLQARSTEIEEISPHTAVVYLIPLADRTEMLVSFHDDLRRVTIPVTQQKLNEQVMRFRYELEDLSTRMHLPHAQQLYRWILGPIDAELQARGIDTLVFVPDGALRLVPMAALHDGEKFLIQRYATAVTPGLTLMDPQPLRPARAHLLAGGLSVEAHDGFPALPHVKEEVNNITSVLGGIELLDQEFLLNRLEQEVTDRSYSIVHLATHGQFGHDARDTFILTYDTKLTLTGLEQLIRPARFRDEPVELLTLSACHTAAGDDRTGLGLAGIALRAGARSALATLWPIHDRAASVLFVEFYSQIQQDPTLTKAKALQRAQLKLIQQWQYDDPYFWSPYLIIGSWI